MREGCLTSREGLVRCTHCSHGHVNLQLRRTAPNHLEQGRRRNSRRKVNTVTQAYGMLAPALAPAGAGLGLSGILSSLSLAVGAFGLAYFLSQDQQQQEPRVECSTCEGTGRVPCVCTRWSDDDRGCSSCRGTGMMACPSCHGGGTAVPIAAKIVVRC